MCRLEGDTEFVSKHPIGLSLNLQMDKSLAVECDQEGDIDWHMSLLDGPVVKPYSVQSNPAVESFVA